MSEKTRERTRVSESVSVARVTSPRVLTASVEHKARIAFRPVEFRRVPDLPPYVFAAVDQLKLELRRAGEDVIDLGFGNPDLPSPPAAVAKLCEAAQIPRNHRYSASRGIPRLRQAICERYERVWGVRLDPETQAITTIGAKEGLAHLMWTLGNLVEAYRRTRPRPRVVLLSFPHNPTTSTVDLAFMQRAVDFAQEHELVLVHDFAYAELGFDDYAPPSILQAEGAQEVAVELYSLTKGYSMAGWRVGFLVGNAEIVGALARLKSWLDYGTFTPIQVAAVIALTESADYPDEVREIYRSRRDALHTGLERIGWAAPKPRATMFLWAPIPAAYRRLGSLELALRLARTAHVALSPGVGFGPGGEGHVRFALVENEQRIGQAVRGIRRALPGLS
jgi:alanine-synthesizing transaminase